MLSHTDFVINPQMLIHSLNCQKLLKPTGPNRMWAAVWGQKSWMSIEKDKMFHQWIKLIMSGFLHNKAFSRFMTPPRCAVLKYKGVTSCKFTCIVLLCLWAWILKTQRHLINLIWMISLDHAVRVILWFTVRINEQYRPFSQKPFRLEIVDKWY